MLAKTTDHLPTTRELTGGVLYDVKFDGFRGLLGIDANGTAHIRSRQGTNLTPAFPDIAAAAQDQLAPGTLLDGELLIWDGEHLAFTELQRRLASPARAAQHARTRPASYLAFDLLQHAGQPLTSEPLRSRRRLLEQLLPSLRPPLQITPATRDRDIAATWFRDHAQANVGVEGLVCKSLAEKYKPGRRTWLKLRSRNTTEAIIGAVIGPLSRPNRLVLGLPDAHGTLRITATTTALPEALQREIAALLTPAEHGHPWPERISAHLAGVWNSDRQHIPLTRVAPTLVLEIDTDTSTDNGRHRHQVRTVPTRPDLAPADLSPSPAPQ